MLGLRGSLGLCVISLGLGLFGQPADAQYGGGTGEPNSPYLIYTAEQMNAIGAEPNDWDKHFKLMADIDLSEYGGTSFNISGYWRNRSDNKPFSGVFDGNGHVISNFSYASTDRSRIGLFGYVRGDNAQIKDLGLHDPNVDAGTWGYVGALVGDANGYIAGCYVQGGSISGDYGVGGLTGYNRGTITDCISSSTVSANRLIVGGLAGFNFGTITHCCSTGDVSGGWAVGGLVGGSEGPITNCCATGSVWGSGQVGGLVGYVNYKEYANVAQCYSTGDVSGDSMLGGLVGTNSGRITNCYATGSASGNEYVGGLTGWNLGAVRHCYATGKVWGYFYVGGLMGWGGTSVTNSFWDIQTSGQTTSDGGTGKTTAEMQMATTFLGWGCDPVWTINEAADYPRLQWENMPGEPIETELSDFLPGTGTLDDPYLVYSAEQLNMIGLFWCEWGNCFKLMADVDLSAYKGTDFNIIGVDADTAFTGVFDGNGKKIFNFSYASTHENYVGVFGYVDDPSAQIRDLVLIDPHIDAPEGDVVGSLAGCVANGTISRCHVEGGSVSGDGLVGGLVGEHRGTITECSSTGSVSGDSDVGGLVGWNDWARITKCYSSTSVKGNSAVGGLVGYAYGTITNCYAAGSIDGDEKVGGLVGEHRSGGAITYCYSVASVAGTTHVGGLTGTKSASGVFRIMHSFWDTQTSGQVIGPRGMDKSTAEMQTASTFTDAGWDFVGESENGTEDIWAICEGQDYPKLTWQFVVGDFDGDAHTDFADFCIFAERWLGTDSSFWCGGGGTDFNNDSNIDFADLKELGDNWLAAK